MRISVCVCVCVQLHLTDLKCRSLIDIENEVIIIISRSPATAVYLIVACYSLV